MADTKQNNNLCLAPWNLLRIETDGNCYSCSSAYVKDFYCLGNLFNDDINEIWNGEKAKAFRKDKLSEEYKYCKINECHLFAKNMNHYTYPKEELIAEFPQYISLSYDDSCSEKCIFCRDKIITIDQQVKEKWESILYKKLIPLVSNAKIMEITCAGELFTSLHSQKILKEIVKHNPNIKLKLFSNGIYATEEKINELGIANNIEEICISLHCATKKTYKKIFRKDHFDKVIKNLEYLSGLKKQSKIKFFNLQFVITKYNYKEIKSFIKITKKLGANAVFNYVNNVTNTEFTRNKYNYALYSPKHYLYNSFINQISDKDIAEYIPFHMKELKKVSIFQIIKNYIIYISEQNK